MERRVSTAVVSSFHCLSRWFTTPWKFFHEMNVQNIICRFLWWYMEVSSNHCQSIIFGYFVNISERLLIEWKKKNKEEKTQR